MKRMLLCLLVPLRMFSQDITGIWIGHLQAEDSLISYELAISQEKDGLEGYAQMTFLVNGVENIGVKKIKLKQGSEVINFEDFDLIYNNYSSKPRRVKLFGSVSLKYEGESAYLVGSFYTRSQDFRSNDKGFYKGTIKLQRAEPVPYGKLFLLLTSLNLRHTLSFVNNPPPRTPRPPSTSTPAPPVTEMASGQIEKDTIGNTAEVTTATSNPSSSAATSTVNPKNGIAQKDSTKEGGRQTAIAGTNASIPDSSGKKQTPGTAVATESSVNNGALKSTGNTTTTSSNREVLAAGSTSGIGSVLSTDSAGKANATSVVLPGIGSQGTTKSEKSSDALNTVGTDSLLNSAVAGKPGNAGSREDSTKVQELNVGMATISSATATAVLPDTDSSRQTIANIPPPDNHIGNEGTLTNSGSGIPQKSGKTSAATSMTSSTANSAKPGAMLRPRQVADPSLRRTEIIETVEFESDILTIAVYDNGEIDGDTVSVFLNQKLLIEKKGLTAVAVVDTINMAEEPGDSVALILYANNLGSIPPNTGLLILRDGVKRYEIRFSGDLQKNPAILLRRKTSAARKP